MPASTHTEVYRRFRGDATRSGFRFLPLWRSEFRFATRKKLPLVLLYGPIVIATIVACVFVYAKFALTEFEPEERSLQLTMVTAMAGQMLEVRNIIVDFNDMMALFAFLVTVWYGAGLICEDKRVNAHLLYFSRPLTRLDYFLGKFAAVASFGALATLVPGLVICSMAVFASPDFAFLTEQGDVILGTFATAFLWISTIGVVVLAVSSIVPKKLFALVGAIGVFMFGEILADISEAISEAVENFPSFSYLGIGRNVSVVGRWLLSPPGTELPENFATSATGVAVTLALGLSAIAWRLRKMEVQA